MLTTHRVSPVNPFVSAAGQGFDNADDQERIDSSTQDVNTVGPSINTASKNINTGSSNINTVSPILNDPSMQSLEATGIFNDAYDDREEVGAEADLNNLETTMNVSSIPTTRIHKDHPIEQIIGDLHSAPLIRRIWIEARQEELLQFKLQKVWTLVDLSKDKRAIGTKWVYRNSGVIGMTMVWRRSWYGGGDVVVGCGDEDGGHDGGFGSGWMVAMMLVTVISFG
ncbi:hypothetical protein Tco_1101351 [Tanacetum coccineum]